MCIVAISKLDILKARSSEFCHFLPIICYGWLRIINIRNAEVKINRSSSISIPPKVIIYSFIFKIAWCTHYFECSCFLPFLTHREVSSSAYPAGWPASQQICSCGQQCGVSLQGFQWCPASHPMAEACGGEWQQIWTRWGPICPGFKGTYVVPKKKLH